MTEICWTCWAVPLGGDCDVGLGAGLDAKFYFSVRADGHGGKGIVEAAAGPVGDGAAADGFAIRAVNFDFDGSAAGEFDGGGAGAEAGDVGIGWDVEDALAVEAVLVDGAHGEGIDGGGDAGEVGFAVAVGGEEDVGEVYGLKRVAGEFFGDEHADFGAGEGFVVLIDDGDGDRGGFFHGDFDGAGWFGFGGGLAPAHD